MYNKIFGGLVGDERWKENGKIICVQILITVVKVLLELQRCANVSTLKAALVVVIYYIRDKL